MAARPRRPTKRCSRRACPCAVGFALATTAERRYVSQSRSAGERDPTQVEEFVAVLQVGAATVDDVVDWADAIKEREASPHWSICELATRRNLYPRDVVHLLQDVPRASDRSETQHLLMQMLGDSSAEDPRRDNQVASSLFNLAMANESRIQNSRRLHGGHGTRSIWPTAA